MKLDGRVGLITSGGGAMDGAQAIRATDQGRRAQRLGQEMAQFAVVWASSIERVTQPPPR
jgi:hypothetical protein